MRTEPDYAEWIRKRITALRLEKGVSARDMSLSLGQSGSYVNKIENGYTLPSLTGFLYICEYFGISPRDFFDSDVASPTMTKELTRAFGKLPPTQAAHVLQLVADLTEA